MKSIPDVDTTAPPSAPILRHGDGRRGSGGWLIEFGAADWDAERAYLDATYGTALSIDGLGPGSSVRHRYGTASGFTVDEVSLRRGVRLVARPGTGVLIALAVDGAVQLGDTELGPGESVLADERRGWTATARSGTVVLIMLEAWLIQRAADERGASGLLTMRNLHPRPVVQQLGEAWQRSVHYVVEMMDARAPRALVDAGGQVLAAAVLACFAPPPAPPTPGGAHVGDLPTPLRRAMAFIAAGAREMIGVNEIAEAVHLSPRAVQYLFRKHLDETPTEHLRRVRLQRAHLDLLAADRSSTTVSEVARRWGFGHTGRFAVLYRETYGVSPHMTLRS